MKRRSFIACVAALFPVTMCKHDASQRILSVVNEDHGRLFDADGLEISEVFEANLDTGACVSYGRNNKGRLRTVRIGDEMRLVPVTTYHKIPLRFERG